MSMFAFLAGTKLMIDEDRYIVRREINGAIELENLNYNKIEIWDKEHLLEKWNKEELVFRNNDWRSSESEIRDFSLLDIDSVNEAKRRYKIIKPVIDGEILPAEIKSYLDTIEPKVSKTTFYEWKSRWEKYEDIRTLVKKKPGPKNHYTKGEIVELIEELVNEFQYSGEKFTDEHLFSEFSLRIEEINRFRDDKNKIKIVSRSTFYRRKKTIEDKFRKEEIRLGKVETELRKKGSRKEVVITKPLERVEIDWTPVDVLLINPSTLKPERPWLVYAIDKATGHPLGFYVTFKDVNASAVKQCLLHSIMPKTYLKKLYPLIENDWVAYGKPSEVVFDNSIINESYDVKDTCQQLNINVHFCKVGAGYQKGTIERGFRTLNTTWIHTLKGTTFSNVYEKGLYDSVGEACITMQTFIYMAHLVMVDVIANSYDKRRGGKPKDLWLKGLVNNPLLQLPIPQSKKELKLIFMSGIDYRKIQNKGVVIENEYYNSKDLMELRANLINEVKHEKKIGSVKVRYDLADMRSVYVYDKFKKIYIQANNTSLERKEIPTNLPVYLSQLELDSSVRTLGANKDDVTNLAKTIRKVKELTNCDKKKYNQQKRNLDQLNKRDLPKSYNYEGISSMGLAELQIESPIEADTIVVHFDEQKERENKQKKYATKSKKEQLQDEETMIGKSNSDYIDLDSLPDYGVSFKK